VDIADSPAIRCNNSFNRVLTACIDLHLFVCLVTVHYWVLDIISVRIILDRLTYH